MAKQKRMRYACVKKHPVFIMDKATRAMKLKGKLAVQSIKTGDVTIVEKRLVKKISYAFPEKEMCK